MVHLKKMAPWLCGPLPCSPCSITRVLPHPHDPQPLYFYGFLLLQLSNCSPFSVTLLLSHGPSTGRRADLSASTCFQHSVFNTLMLQLSGLWIILAASVGLGLLVCAYTVWDVHFRGGAWARSGKRGASKGCSAFSSCFRKVSEQGLAFVFAHCCVSRTAVWTVKRNAGSRAAADLLYTLSGFL